MADLTSSVMQVLLYYEGASDKAENIPGDAGGLTKYGIAQASHPNVDIENLTLDGAIAIYTKEYWNLFHCNLINSPFIGTQLFLGVVNTNQKDVQKALQLAYNSLNIGTPLVVDGSVGQGTANAINSLSDSNIYKLSSLMSDKMDAHYRAIVASNPNDSKFLTGWLRRAHWPYMNKGSWPYIDPNYFPHVTV